MALKRTFAGNFYCLLKIELHWRALHICGTGIINYSSVKLIPLAHCLQHRLL